MSKYQYTEKCREVSGFGGGYEDACRKMVQTGMEWLDKHKEANPTFDQFKNVYGLTTNENDDMKDMQSAMNEAISNGASGAMMQVSTNHVLYANKNGWEKYISEMEKVTIKSQRKPTCFNGGMNLVDNFAKIFGSLK